ncbi:hypothetical protein GH714_029630 [Hevea brasiliensis]|uniref:Uncharacterized protein n=1 Tax=Hevea brasiliensis TaxID=3981 RepID=A0A6A6M6E4_HEVBR|nr:hypothetical protein GH714_029630 [Hevea brasiliensis]
MELQGKMTKRVNFAIHCGGKWQSIDTMVYDGDEVIYHNAIDIDYQLMFEMLGYAKELKHKNGAHVWLKIYGLIGPKSYEEILSDVKHVREFHADGRDGDLELGQTVKTGTGDIENEIEASWLYDDMEDTDDDIFMNVPCADVSNSPPKETSRDYGETHRVHIDAIDLQEEDFTEFNEDAESNEDLHSLQGSKDEQEDYPNFDEASILKDPQLCLGMKFTNWYVYRKALKEWAVKRGENVNEEQVESSVRDLVPCVSIHVIEFLHKSKDLWWVEANSCLWMSCEDMYG